MRRAANRLAVTNLAGCQVTWFACVIGAGNGVPEIGPLVAAGWMTLHLASIGGGRAVELRLVIAAVILGYLLDSALVLLRAFAFPEHAGPAMPTTPWMVALWAGFASTLRHGLNALRERYVLGGIAGAVLGPLAYQAGHALGAITLAAPPLGWLAIAVEWAFAMPALLWLREWVEAPTAARAQACDPENATGGRR